MNNFTPQAAEPGPDHTSVRAAASLFILLRARKDCSLFSLEKKMLYCLKKNWYQSVSCDCCFFKVDALLMQIYIKVWHRNRNGMMWMRKVIFFSSSLTLLWFNSFLIKMPPVPCFSGCTCNNCTNGEKRTLTELSFIGRFYITYFSLTSITVFEDVKAH